MDLLDFEGQDLYFDEPLSSQVNELLEQASRSYGDGNAELPLLQAYLLAPDHLTVLVALYRYYYYQHRYKEAMFVANQAIDSAARALGIPAEWSSVNLEHLGVGAMKSMGLVRFYLLAIKAAGYLHLRLEEIEEGAAKLKKVVALDKSDRLGTRALLGLVKDSVGLDNSALKIAVG